MARLTPVDRKLIGQVQSRFPLCRRPYAKIGESLGLTERGVIRRLASLKRAGVIRRIGPVYDARACGLATTLVALSVPPRRVPGAARLINRFAGVTHNYLRAHPLNMWFTLTSADAKTERRLLRRIRKLVSPARWIELPACEVFSIGLLPGVDVPGRGTRRSRRPGAAGRRSPGTSLTRGFARIPFDLPLRPEPFPRGALSDIRRLRAACLIRRFGAVADEKKIGYRFTTLAAWRAAPRRLRAAGKRLASFPQVSHCYARKTKKGWRYNLYTVIHERSRPRGLRLVEEMARAAGIRDYVVLETLRRLKRSSLDMRGFSDVEIIGGIG